MSPAKEIFDESVKLGAESSGEESINPTKWGKKDFINRTKPETTNDEVLLNFRMGINDISIHGS